MSMSHKLAWGQLAIFALLVIGWLIIFLSNGTVLYWQDDTMKNAFYYLSGGAFALLVLMNLGFTIWSCKTKVQSDERDKLIFRRASLWATGVSYTVVAVLLLVLSIAYMSQGKEMISVYFPLFIVLIGGVVLLLTQAITALILYGRDLGYE